MFHKKAVLLKALQYSQDRQENACVRVSRIFKSTYFEENLRTAASENMFIKLRKIIHKEF